MAELRLKSTSGAGRRLRLGMVGGGRGAFIGVVHRMASRLDNRYELVAGVFSSDARRARVSGRDLGIARDRIYTSYLDMADRSRREDGVEVVSIVTPNNVHFGPAKAFLEAGIHVILDKPLTATLAEAIALERIARNSRLIVGLTHTYTGYPMVRQAREMALAGALGKVRLIQVEYPQEWLTLPLEKSGNKQAQWRTDPNRSGPAGALGDIGTHAYNMACFVTGLKCEAVAADVHTFVSGRRVDDNVHVLMRFGRGAKGMLWASQVAVGCENDLQLRVFGEAASLRMVARGDELSEVLRTMASHPNASAAPAPARPLGRCMHRACLPGTPEGYIEAFAQICTRDLAERISARIERRRPDAASLLVPGIAEGVSGMRFIDAVLRSSRRDSAWTHVIQ